MDKVDFKKLGLIYSLEKLSEEIMKLEPYINDEDALEKFDTAVTTLDLIIGEVENNG